MQVRRRHFIQNGQIDDEASPRYLRSPSVWSGHRPWGAQARAPSSHEVAAALAEQQAAGEEQRATEDSVTRQVWDAYVDYQTAVEQQRSSKSFLAAAQTSYDSSLDAYKYGVRSLVDVVASERQLAEARLVTVRSQAQLMQSAVALGYATGVILKGTTTPGVRP